MSRELETEINEDLYKEKINKFFTKNKFKILLIFIVLLLSLLSPQFYFYFDNKKNEKLTVKYFKSLILVEKNQEKFIENMKLLSRSKNQTIALLSFNSLIDYYISKGKIEEILSLINSYNYNFDSDIYNELINLKKIIILFDDLKEEEFLTLIKKSNNFFPQIVNQLTYDFYIKIGHYKKASQILNKK